MLGLGGALKSVGYWACSPLTPAPPWEKRPVTVPHQSVELGHRLLHQRNHLTPTVHSNQALRVKGGKVIKALGVAAPGDELLNRLSNATDQPQSARATLALPPEVLLHKGPVTAPVTVAQLPQISVAGAVLQV